MNAKTYKITQSKQAFRLLSENIYNYPLLSTFKELVSNAIDSHHKAGKPDAPVEINLSFNKKEDKSYGTLSIKDSGVGLSLDEIKNIYTVYFQTDKNNDKTQIGGFGLGAKSPFSIAEQFTVIAVKNGLMNVVLCRFEDSVPVWEVLVENKPVQQDNGVEVNVVFESKDRFLNEKRPLLKLIDGIEDKQFGSKNGFFNFKYTEPAFLPFLWSIPANFIINGHRLPDYKERAGHEAEFGLAKSEKLLSKPFLYLNGIPAFLKDMPRLSFKFSEDIDFERSLSHFLLKDQVYTGYVPLIYSDKIPLTPSREFVFFSRNFEYQDLLDIIYEHVFGRLGITGTDLKEAFFFLVSDIFKSGLIAEHDGTKDEVFAKYIDRLNDAFETGKLPDRFKIMFKPQFRFLFSRYFQNLVEYGGLISKDYFEDCWPNGVMKSMIFHSLSSCFRFIFSPTLMLVFLHKTKTVFSKEVGVVYFEKGYPPKMNMNHVSGKKISTFMATHSNNLDKTVKMIRLKIQSKDIYAEDILFLEGYRPKRKSYFNLDKEDIKWNSVLIGSSLKKEALESFCHLYGAKFVDKDYLQSPVKIKNPEVDANQVCEITFDENNGVSFSHKPAEIDAFKGAKRFLFINIAIDTLPSANRAVSASLVSFLKNHNIVVLSKHSKLDETVSVKFAETLKNKGFELYNSDAFLRKPVAFNTSLERYILSSFWDGIIQSAQHEYRETLFKIGHLVDITYTQKDIVSFDGYLGYLAGKLIKDNDFVKDFVSLFSLVDDNASRSIFFDSVHQVYWLLKKCNRCGKDGSSINTLSKRKNDSFALLIKENRHLQDVFLKTFEEFIRDGVYPDKDKVFKEMITSGGQDILDKFVQAYEKYYAAQGFVL